MKSKDHIQRRQVDQSEREETEVDSLLEALLEEHGHADTVGGEADKEEDGDEDCYLDSVKSCLASKPMRLLGLFHGMVVFIPKMMQFSGTLFADWLMLSTVHGDVIFVSLTVVSYSRII